MPDPSSTHCSDHPDRALVPFDDRTAPWDRRGHQWGCVDPSHGWHGRHRCANCGGPIQGRRAYAAVYCGGSCRVAAHRAKQRGTREPAGRPVTPNPGPNPVASPAADGVAPEVQE